MVRFIATTEFFSLFFGRVTERGAYILGTPKCMFLIVYFSVFENEHFIKIVHKKKSVVVKTKKTIL